MRFPWEAVLFHRYSMPRECLQFTQLLRTRTLATSMDAGEFQPAQQGAVARRAKTDKAVSNPIYQILTRSLLFQNMTVASGSARCACCACCVVMRSSSAWGEHVFHGATSS